MQTLNLHTSDGVIVRAPGVGILDAYGKTVPADGSNGYATGCIFRNTAGGDATALYVNEGTEASCNFNAVTVSA